MLPAEIKDNLIDGALVISTVMILTRVIITEVVHVVDCCKDSYYHVRPSRKPVAQRRKANP